MKLRKKTLILATFFIVSISLYACKEEDLSLPQEDLEMVNAEKNAEEKQEDFIDKDKAKDQQEDSISRNEKNSPKQLTRDLPEFIGSSLEFGTYSEKIRIPNENNIAHIAINAENRMEIPECDVLSILFDTLYNDIVLYEESPEEIKDFFDNIQKLEIEKEKEFVNTLPLDADCLFAAHSVMIDGDGKYISMYIRSFSDSMHYFEIYQENQDVIYASAKSESLLDMVKKMAGLKSINISKLDKIEKLEAFIDNSWMLLDEERKDMFQALIKDKVKKIKNYSGGCPFDYRLKATLSDGEIVDIYYVSDSCGALVIGDATYEVELAPEEGEEFKYRDQLADFFRKP